MQRAEAKQSPIQTRDVAQSAKSSTPLGEVAAGDSMAPAQRRMVDAVRSSPRMAVQRAMLHSVFGGVVQAKTNVTVNLNDATDDKTSNKKIATPTQGEKWFRFAKDGNKINSFGNNITSQSPKGNSPVATTIDLGGSKEVKDKSEIPDMSRATHFGLGDRMIGKDANFRSGTWTWHHKVDPYKMELVDMYAHGGFFHYGGFSQWGDLDPDDSSD